MTAWPSLIERLEALHALPVAACPFERRLAGMMARAEAVVAAGAVNPDFLAEEDRDVDPAVLLGRLRPLLPEMLAREQEDRVVCHGDATLANLMVDPDTLLCTGMIDLGRLGVADPYADFVLLHASARETWDRFEDRRIAIDLTCRILGIQAPDEERILFYLTLDPLTWHSGQENIVSRSAERPHSAPQG